MKLGKAALDYASKEYYDDRNGVSSLPSFWRPKAFIAGAEFERKRIIELLRGMAPLQQSAVQWASWIEVKLQEMDEK